MLIHVVRVPYMLRPIPFVQFFVPSKRNKNCLTMTTICRYPLQSNLSVTWNALKLDLHYNEKRNTFLFSFFSFGSKNFDKTKISDSRPRALSLSQDFCRV